MAEIRSRYEYLVTIGTVAGVLSLAAVWIVAAVIWPKLPERIPVHFGLDGAPDRFGDKSVGNWYGLPAVVTAFALFFFGIERLVLLLARRRPGSVNVPRKKEFVALPEGARVRAFRPMTALMRGTLAPVALVFTFILCATYVAATGGSVQGATFLVGTFGGVAAALAWTAVCLVALARAIRGETARAASGAPPES